MSYNKDFGDYGELLAKQYLEHRGYITLETNWRFKKAEVDLIVKFEDVLVFVEVKTRSSSYFGRPEEFVSRQKEQMLFAAANEYMEQIDHKWEIRFDIISIVKKKGEQPVLEHFIDAFFPGF